MHIVGNESSVEGNWTSTWNNNNIGQVDYNSIYLDPIPLDMVYAENTRSAEQELIGYAYSAGQPINFSYKNIKTYSNGAIDSGDVDNYREGDNIIIPSHCDDGKPILKIASNAFESISVDKCIINYYDEPIEIESSAFYFSEVKEVIINRDVNFSSDLEEYTEIFSNSQIESIVLPDSVTCLPESMFAYCEYLTNIFFEAPNRSLSKDDLLNLISNLIQEKGNGIVKLPNIETFRTIGTSAFEEVTCVSELHIYENVTTIRESAISGWTNEQSVFVHNTRATPKYSNETKTGWHQNWHDEQFKIKYDKYIFTISLDPNQGTLYDNNELEVELNKNIGSIPTPTREGYRFDGWYDDETLYNETTVYTYEKGITLLAHWSKMYQIELKSTDGKITYFTIEAVQGEYLPLKDIKGEILETLDENGKKFKGFMSENGLTTYYDENMCPSKWFNIDDLVIYAQWEEDSNETVTIVFQESEILPLEVEVGNKMPEVDSSGNRLIPPEKTGYNFGGYEDKDNNLYYDSNMCSVRDCDNENGILILLPIWIEKTTIIHYELSGGTHQGNPSSITYSQKVTLNAAKAEYDKFSGWYLNGEKVEYLTNREEKEITLIATWEKSHIVIEPQQTFTHTSIKISGEKEVIVYLPNEISRFVFTISSNVDKVYFVSSGLSHIMSIQIASRNSECSLILHNLSIFGFAENIATATQPKYVFYNPIVMGNSTLNLETHGDVNLTGARGVSNAFLADMLTPPSENCGMSGSPAISCDALIVKNFGNLSINGGHGGDPLNKNLRGDGGVGGCAILAKMSIVIESSVFELTIIGGKGGSAKIDYGIPGKGGEPYIISNGNSLENPNNLKVYLAKGLDGNIVTKF